MSCTFHGFVAIRKSFSVKFGDVVSFGAAKVSNLESFFHNKKIIIFTSLREFFSLESFLLYTVLYPEYTPNVRSTPSQIQPSSRVHMVMVRLSCKYKT